MKKGKKLPLILVLAGLVSGSVLTVLVYRISVWTRNRRLLPKVDVFAEPLTEKLNELFDTVVVAFDLAIGTVTSILPQPKAKSVKIEKRVKTSPGRYVTVKNQH